MRHSSKFAMILLGGLGTLLALGVASVALADNPTAANRYPYDPVCSWGRVADGRGMIVRCLTQGEADHLRSGSAPGAVASADAAPEPGAPASTTAIALTVGPVEVDSGELPLALKKLSVPQDRYQKCIEDNGGLRGDEGEVQVRFLVRERGRAEGVVVKKRRAVSEKAAACIADVVDRRFVGHPDVPIVGATLVVKVTKAHP